MLKQKKFDSRKILSKTSRKLNLGVGLGYGGLVAIGVGGLMSFAELSKARTPLEMKMAMSTLIGGIVAGFAVGLAGKKMSSTILKKLIGKPRVCRKIADDIIDKKQRMFVRTLGHVNWKNQTVRDAFRVSYVSGRATQTARNIVERETIKAMKKAEYDEALFSV